MGKGVVTKETAVAKLNQIGGLPIKDAPHSIQIHITRSDCERGDRRGPASCAGALACRRVPGCSGARVHRAYTYLKMGKVWWRFHTSAALKTELVVFDRGGRFQPGDFILRPRSFIERTRRKPRGPHTSKRRRFKTHILEGVRPRGGNA